MIAINDSLDEEVDETIYKRPEIKKYSIISKEIILHHENVRK